MQRIVSSWPTLSIGYLGRHRFFYFSYHVTQAPIYQGLPEQYYQAYHSHFIKSRQRKKPFWGLRNSNIINKSSKSFDAYRLETQTAQPCGKLAGICLPTPFPHPLQNRVPRVRILLPLPQINPGIPRNSGIFLCFWVVVCGLQCRSLWRVFCAFFVSGRICF